MRSGLASDVLLVSLCCWAAGCATDSTPVSPSGPPSVTTSTTTSSVPPSPPAPTTTSTTTSVPPQSQVLRRATFEGANGYTTEGSARIVRENGQHRLELGSDFRTNNSAALDVRLCTDRNCRGSELNLGDLQRFSGSQTYSLPNDGGEFDYVVIYCRGVRLPFGSGRLR